MAQELLFNPFPLLGSPHLQTIANSIISAWTLPPPATQKIIHLPDGDRLSLEIITPKQWTPKDPTVVLLHGLCGSHNSPYMVRIAKRSKTLGIRSIRINMRGCGSGRKMAKKFHHGGRSEDILEVLKILKAEYPTSKYILLGYSLGGNIALKLAGELGENGSHFLNKVIAISPPADLLKSVKMFDRPENKIYEKYFFREIHSHYLDVYPDPPFSIPKKMFEFDDLITAPGSGFAGALDYYAKCSSASLIPKIRIPCKILFAEDDPFIAHAVLDQVELPTHIEVFKTKKGGHLGFLGHPLHKKGVRWLDSLLIEWITDT